MEKSQRSEEPVSKSKRRVWPPTEMGARNSWSFCSGVAVVSPVSWLVVGGEGAEEEEEEEEGSLSFCEVVEALRASGMLQPYFR